MMINIILLLGAVLLGLIMPTPAHLKSNVLPKGAAYFKTLLSAKRCDDPYFFSAEDVKALLNQPGVGMKQSVISKVIRSYNCAQFYHLRHKPILTVIDYSLPSSEKRIWVFDVKRKKLLFHTYVSHGITSGTLFSDQFSNRYNSKASSIGVYRTEQSYYGRHGVSLRLAGLEPGFNDNAMRRAVVMHGGWYVDEGFIKKYGRAGRSWGCPAVPKELTKPIINAIKEEGLMVIYYPEERWIKRSKYLTCGKQSPIPDARLADTTLQQMLPDREGILFVERNKNDRREESEPILVVSADDYARLFYPKKVPLKRMLRRQINGQEYVALSNTEFNNIISNTHHDFSNTIPKPYMEAMCFVIPEVKFVRGYYHTEMKIVPMGEVTSIQHRDGGMNEYTVTLGHSRAVHLKTTHRFIRWLGL